MLESIVSLQGTRYQLALNLSTGAWEYRPAVRIGRDYLPAAIVAKVRDNPALPYLREMLRKVQ